MARFMNKALAVAALVCLVVDWSQATDTQQQGTNTMETVKHELSGVLDSIKKTATQTFNNVKESDNTKKIESQLSSFYSSAMDKLKSFTFSKPVNADDQNKQQAINAFDQYAANHKN